MDGKLLLILARIHNFTSRERHLFHSSLKDKGWGNYQNFDKKREKLFHSSPFDHHTCKNCTMIAFSLLLLLFVTTCYGFAAYYCSRRIYRLNFLFLILK